MHISESFLSADDETEVVPTNVSFINILLLIPITIPDNIDLIEKISSKLYLKDKINVSMFFLLYRFNFFISKDVKMFLILSLTNCVAYLSISSGSFTDP